MVEASKDAKYSSKSRALVSKGDTPSAHVLNLGEGSIIFARPGDSDDILPELSARLESSTLDTRGERIVIVLHNQEGWGSLHWQQAQRKVLYLKNMQLKLYLKVVS